MVNGESWSLGVISWDLLPVGNDWRACRGSWEKIEPRVRSSDSLRSVKIQIRWLIVSPSWLLVECWWNRISFMKSWDRSDLNMASDLIRRCKPLHHPPFHLFRFLALAFPPPFFFLLQCFSSKLSFFGPVHSVLRFTDDESYHEGHGHAYSNYGIDPSVGCVVILRPDQYVSLVTDLSDHHGIGSSLFFFISRLTLCGVDRQVGWCLFLWPVTFWFTANFFEGFMIPSNSNWMSLEKKKKKWKDLRKKYI